MASSKTIGGINVTISATTDKFVKGISTARKVLGAFTKAVSGAIFSLKGLAVAFAAGAFAKFTANAFESIDALAKTADRLNMTTEALAGLQLAADEAGIPISVLERSLLRLTEKTGKNPAEAMMDFADAIARTSDPAKQLEMSVKMFGTRGASMINLLRGGRPVLEEAAQAAKDLGLAIDRGSAAGVERAIDTFGRFKTAVGGIFRQVAIDIAPFVEVLSVKLTDFIAQGGKAQAIGGKIADAIIGTAKFIANGIQKMVGAVMSFVADFRRLLFDFRSGVVGKSMGLGYANDSQQIFAGAAAITAQNRAGRFNSAAPWGDTIDRLAADARASAANTPTWAPKSTNLLKRIGSRFAESVMSGAASRFQNFGGPLARLYAKSMMFGAMNPVVGSSAAIGSAQSGSLSAQDPLSREGYSQRVRSLAQRQLQVGQQQLAVQKGIQNGVNKLAANSAMVLPLNLA